MSTARKRPASTVLKELDHRPLAAWEREVLELMRLDRTHEIGLPETSGDRTAHLGHREFPQRDRRSDDAVEVFEGIVRDMVGESESEVAVEVLLGLIRREAEALQTTMRDEVEVSVRSNARIEQRLNEAAHHRAGTDEWLSRLR